jgi:alkylation response protein AidB-like acyl-CoA dehydrogenase
MTSPTPLPGLDDARTVLAAAEALVERAVARAREITANGERIDDHQVLADRVAYAATEARAARELVAYADEMKRERRADAQLETLAAASVADLALAIRNRIEPALGDLGLDEAAIDAAFPASVRALLRRAANESVFRSIGRHVAETRGRNTMPLDEISEQVRDAVREFAEKEIAPHAERIHRHDELVPEAFISKMSELGYFAMSVPEEFGGQEFGNLAMILTTEELSRASLAAAGSLITRPEILTKALIQGGTAEQKKHWLPKIAAGELMVGISVTEPDVGSDVASLKCRADRATVGGRDGWIINGPKSWCTFAGRANVLALLARTDPDLAKGAKQAARGRPHGRQSRCNAGLSRHALVHADARELLRTRGEPGGRRRRNRQGLLPADGRLRGRAAADRWTRLRSRTGGTREDGGVRRRSRAVPKADQRVSTHAVQARSNGSAAGGRARDHVRRCARDGRRRAQGRTARRAGQVARL